MPRHIEVSIDDPIHLFIDKARQTANAKGMLFDGDHSGGAFAGFGIEGHYRIDADLLRITIVRKPVIVPWGVIESKIQGFFQGAL